jgi:hypothetical protein
MNFSAALFLARFSAAVLIIFSSSIVLAVQATRDGAYNRDYPQEGQAGSVAFSSNTVAIADKDVSLGESLIIESGSLHFDTPNTLKIDGNFILKGDTIVVDFHPESVLDVKGGIIASDLARGAGAVNFGNMKAGYFNLASSTFNMNGNGYFDSADQSSISGNGVIVNLAEDRALNFAHSLNINADKYGPSTLNFAPGSSLTIKTQDEAPGGLEIGNNYGTKLSEDIDSDPTIYQKQRIINKSILFIKEDNNINNRPVNFDIQTFMAIGGFGMIEVKKNSTLNIIISNSSGYLYIGQINHADALDLSGKNFKDKHGGFLVIEENSSAELSGNLLAGAGSSVRALKNSVLRVKGGARFAKSSTYVVGPGSDGVGKIVVEGAAFFSPLSEIVIEDISAYQEGEVIFSANKYYNDTKPRCLTNYLVRQGNDIVIGKTKFSE